jgi:methionyl-tRNA formyltransferase
MQRGVVFSSKISMKNISVIIFLSGDRGLSVLEKLLQENINIIMAVMPNNVDDKYIHKINLLHDRSAFKILFCTNPNEISVIKILEEISCNFFIVAGFPTIFKERLLAIPKKGSLNLHAGKLPKYRGGSPLNWQIINGEEKIGISIILLNSGIDTGPIVAQNEIDVPSGFTIADAHIWANQNFPSMTLTAMQKILEDDATSIKVQNELEAVYWHQRNDDDGEVIFSTSTVHQADRMIRALGKPYSGAWAYHNGVVVRIYEAELVKFAIRGVPGRVCYIKSRGPYVICLDGAILLAKYYVSSGGAITHGTRFK